VARSRTFYAPEVSTPVKLVFDSSPLILDASPFAMGQDSFLEWNSGATSWPFFRLIT
jgi:hypothetical protein